MNMDKSTSFEAAEPETVTRSAPTLLMPSPNVFAARASYLRQYADGHLLGDYIRFVARIAECQQALLGKYSGVYVPDVKLLVECKQYRLPPLAPEKWNRNMVWLMILEDLVKHMLADATPSARAMMMDLLDKDFKWLESEAEKLLMSQFDEVDLASAPLIGAALQVYWTQLARTLMPAQVSQPAHANLCPVCGCHPIAAIAGEISNGSEVAYLQCALCSCEWRVEGADCSKCGEAKWLSFFKSEHDATAVAAESCVEYQTCFKAPYIEKDIHSETYDGNLVAIALDLLRGGMGNSRSSYMMRRTEKGSSVCTRF